MKKRQPLVKTSIALSKMAKEQLDILSKEFGESVSRLITRLITAAYERELKK